MIIDLPVQIQCCGDENGERDIFFGGHLKCMIARRRKKHTNLSVSNMNISRARDSNTVR